jgi:hypothetical protein
MAVQTLITIFTEKRYMRALSQDAPAILGSGLEELFRCGTVLDDCCA